MRSRLVASMMLASFILSSTATAAVDEKYRKGWEVAFQYIEDTFFEGALLDTGLQFLPTKYIPYLGQGKKIMARAANNLSMRLTPLGIDSAKYVYTEFDTIQLLRVLAALEYGSKQRLPAATRGELLAYSLCPWMQPQCTSAVKTAIYERRGWQL